MIALTPCSGVAYSKHIVHIYSYHGGDELRNHLEVLIELHNQLILFTIMNFHIAFRIWRLNFFREYFQIDAHVGNVSDLAFSHPFKQLCIITCGDDKAIKVWFVWHLHLREWWGYGIQSQMLMFLQVWDAATGSKQYTFEGHEAPVYSVCPHFKENIQVFVC